MRRHFRSCARPKLATSLHTMIVVGLVLAGLACAIPAFILEPHPTPMYDRDVSLAEAQGLVPFTVCLPHDLPADVDSTPRIFYHYMVGDPEESYITVSYLAAHGSTMQVEVEQRYEPTLVDKDLTHEAVTRQGYTHALIRWFNATGEPSLPQDGVMVTASAYQFDGVTYSVFELTEPNGVQANAVAWLRAPVLYTLYSRLSIDAAKETAASVSRCLGKSQSVQYGDADRSNRGASRLRNSEEQSSQPPVARRNVSSLGLCWRNPQAAREKKADSLVETGRSPAK